MNHGSRVQAYVNRLPPLNTNIIAISTFIHKRPSLPILTLISPKPIASQTPLSPAIPSPSTIYHRNHSWHSQIPCRSRLSQQPPSPHKMPQINVADSNIIVTCKVHPPVRAAKRRKPHPARPIDRSLEENKGLFCLFLFRFDPDSSDKHMTDSQTHLLTPKRS